MSNLLATIDRLTTLINNELIQKQTTMNDLKKDFNHADPKDVDAALRNLLQHIMDKTGLTCDNMNNMNNIGCFTADDVVSQIRWDKEVQKEQQAAKDKCTQELDLARKEPGMLADLIRKLHESADYQKKRGHAIDIVNLLYKQTDDSLLKSLSDTEKADIFQNYAEKKQDVSKLEYVNTNLNIKNGDYEM